MKTCGEILKAARLTQGLTLEGVEKAIKIRVKYLAALEKNEYQKLPSATYIKGFLKNYSQFLGLSPEKILALFRRQFDERKNLGLLPSGLVKPLNAPFFKVNPSLIFFFSLFFLMALFFGYLYREYRSFTKPPLLMVEKPKDQEVMPGKNLEILGRTDPEVTLTLNGQIIPVGKDGTFGEKITVTEGITILNFSAKNKLGKESKLSRTVKVENP